MQTILDAFRNALRLILDLDPDVVQYAGRSLLIAGVSTAVACAIGVPLGILLSEREFRGKRLVVTGLNTLLAVPTVVVGLMVYTLISRTGPLGSWGLLFTVPGIVFGEVILILPIVLCFTVAAISRVDRDVRRTAMGLGAGESRIFLTVLREARFGVMAAVIASFGRVVSEVGVAMILGGNVDGHTRTMTTAIMLITDQGHFALALALGSILLLIALSANVLLQWLQGRGSGE